MSSSTAWLLDIQPQADGLLSYWLTTTGQRLTLILPDVYARVYARPQPGITDLAGLSQSLQNLPFIHHITQVPKRVSIHDHQLQETWELHIPLHQVTQQNFRQYRDLLPVIYYNNDLTPFQHVYSVLRLFLYCFTQLQYADNRITEFTLQDKLTTLHHTLPPVTAIQLDVAFRSQTAKTRLKSLSISPLDHQKSERTFETVVFTDAPETELLLNAIHWINEVNPDVIVTQGGDIDLRFLAHRATVLGLGDLSLSRNPKRDAFSHAGQVTSGQSFMSYGGHYHKSRAYLWQGGRHHIDLRNSFTWADGGFAGIVELARLACINPQRCERASIGTNLTGMQIRQALSYEGYE